MNSKFLRYMPLIIIIIGIGIYFWHQTNFTLDISHSIDFVIRIISTDDTDHDLHGTAFFISENRLITNKHVVYNAETNQMLDVVGICGYENEEVVLEVIYLSEEIDFAVLEGDFHCNHTISEIDTKYDIELNHDITVIGYTQRAGMLIYTGSIAGYISDIEYGDELFSAFPISTDVHPGMSGSPIIDSYGKVIGIATFRVSLDTGNNLDYVSFGIPISMVYDDIKDNTVILD